MESKAIVKYLRVSPLKMRKIVKVIKYNDADQAMNILKLMPNKSAKMIYKAIASAKANFENLYPETSSEGLKIQRIFVDQAPVLKRVLPRARGRADILRKQSSHLTVVLSDDVSEDK